ncbi:MAG: insulinase family protein [Oscillospiraceae bacterium]|nr:insulinase family protein [Oscillospiraceae bacterium]
MRQHWKRLADGVELAVNQTDKFKTGLLGVTLTVPLGADTATAGALIPEVLGRGSSRYPDMEKLSAAADALYGASLGPVVRQRGESQCVSFLCSFIDDRYALDGSAVLEPAAKLMGEVLLDPVLQGGLFRRDYVESEGANLADRIQARVNDKRSWAVFRLIQEMCAGETYAVDKLGDAERARTMTPDELWAAYRSLLSGAKVNFYYGGGALPERVEDAVRHAFAPLLTGRDAPVRCQVIAEPKGPVRTVTDAMDVTQGKLAMGFRTGGITVESEDYPALLVCNTLFGAGANSRLFLNVREKMSLCYYASSALDKLKGLMVVSSGVEFAQFDRAQEAILEQLDEVRQGRFSGEELNAAIRSVVSDLWGRQDSQGQMEDDRLTGLLFHCAAGEGEALAQKVERVTADQVAEVAQKLKLDTIYRLTGKEG